MSFGRYNMLVYEPCNFASNLAYYHAVTKICDYPHWSISEEMQQNGMRSFATLAMGSAFMHLSYTYVGARIDNMIISFICYLGQEILLEHIPTKSLILDGFDTKARTMNRT